ncbi:hypothetical protein PIROE2DRAFT_61501 [Piromyces sp. E2]|nr:hypothetical protein PIROE2DRAFT_61501 [Piromyces sp. E2]|eukprot:OUM63080.1 hypothetical protein PIROE2DRAFT_61501 [Piromyces sp. E2]
MKYINLSLLTLLVSRALAKDSFFGDVSRAKIFEKTDFVVPKVTLNFTEEGYRNFFLRYECEHDMNNRYLIENKECYTAPWVDYTYALNKLFRHQYISKESIVDKDDLAIANKENVTVSDFEYILHKYSDYTMQEIMATSYGLYKFPDYEAEAGLTFDIDGYIY